MHSDGLGFHQAASPRGRTLRVRIPPNARFGRSVREEVFAFAGRFDIRRDHLDEFVFALGEALANAIEHSHSTDVIEIRCQVEDDKILATILDSGSGFESNAEKALKLPDTLAERGRGLPIMRRFSDIFAVHSVPGRGTAVVLGRYLRDKHGLDNPDQETDLAS